MTTSGCLTDRAHVIFDRFDQVLKDCPWSREATITVQRGGMSTPTKNKWKKAIKEEPTSPRKPPLGGLFRSKTPTADLYRLVM